jgi:cell shape-determining protein MreC
MPAPNLLLEPLGRLIGLLERRRGLAVALAAAALLAVGSVVEVVNRPPLLTPAVEGFTAICLEAFSQPVRLVRFFTGPRVPNGRVLALELELASLRRAERENLRLRAMLGYSPPTGYRTVPARVIGLDLDPLQGIAWLDAGTGSGVREGSPVVTVDGLIGVVDRAWGGRSRVRLLVNEDTAVSVRNTRSRALGVAAWDPGGGRIEVGQVPFQADFAVGDTLVSSGLGGVFPPDLPVGTVAQVSEPPERLLKEVELEPFASFYRLEEVFVLLPPAGAPAFGTPDSLGSDRP